MTDLVIFDGPRLMLARHDSRTIDSASHHCIGGSRGQSWYWLIEVGSTRAEARRKPEARAELTRLAREAVAS